MADDSEPKPANGKADAYVREGAVGLAKWAAIRGIGERVAWAFPVGVSVWPISMVAGETTSVDVDIVWGSSLSTLLFVLLVLVVINRYQSHELKRLRARNKELEKGVIQGKRGKRRR